MPKASFVMPVKNGGKFIEKTIKSIQNQTEKDIEIVVVNDHSTDDTLKIAQKLARDDARIKCIDLVDGTGSAAGRNAGTKIANGDIILPTDADDPCFPDRAEISIREIKINNADIFYGNLMRYYTETGEKKPRHFQPYNEKILRNVNIIPNTASAYKKEVFDNIGGYDTNLKIGEDYDFWLSAQEKGYKFCSLNKPVTQYSMHAGQLTGESISSEKIKERQKWNRLVRKKHNIDKVDIEYIIKHASSEVLAFYTKKNYDIWFSPESIPAK